MASRSMSALLVLGFVVVAAFCLSEANATDSVVYPEHVKIKITVDNKCGYDLKLHLDVKEVKAPKEVDCKKGKVAVWHPVTVKLVPRSYKLKLMLTVYDHHGKPLKLKVVAYVDVHKLGKVIKGVVELVLHVVKDVDGKVIKLLCGNTEITKFKLKH